MLNKRKLRPHGRSFFLQEAGSIIGTLMLNLFARGISALVALTLLPGSAAGQAADQRTVIQWMHAGSDAVRRGDLKAGEGYFRQVVAAAPGLSDGYLGLGMVELRQGELESAIETLRQATELNPQLKGAHMFLGMAQYQAGDLAGAATSLQAEVARQPDDAEALTWLGIAELGLNKPEAATAPLDHAAALAPKNPQVLFYRARAHHLVAEDSYVQLRELDPDSVFVHRALGETLAASGQHEKAVEEYEAAIRKEPDNPDLYEALGEEQQRLARFEAAEVTYEKELKLHPNSAIALYNLGRIDVEHGRAVAGVALLRQAQRAHALAAPTDFYLGLGLAETGNPEEAAHWLEEAIRSNPSPFIEQSAYYQVARVYQRLSRKDDAQRALEELKRLKAEAAKQISGGDGGTAPLSSDAPQTRGADTGATR